MSDWKALREGAGLTLAELAEKSGYSIGTINGLELKGEGSQRLKDRLTEVLKHLASKESVTDGRSESAKLPVELHDQPRETRTLEQCLQRIKELEDDNERLRAMVAAAAAPRGVRYQLSSSPRLSEAQAIAKRAGDAHDQRPPK